MSARPSYGLSIHVGICTVGTIILTIRRTVVLAVRMSTSLAAPSKIGPTAIPPPAAVLSRLARAMLAESMLGTPAG